VSRPRILFLAPKPPYPLTSGMAIRQFHLIRAYSTVASVEVAFFSKDDRDLAQASAGLAPYSERLHAFPFPPARRPGWLGLWNGLGRVVTHPMLADILDSRGLQSLVAGSAGSTDLIHVSRLHLVNAVRPLLNGQRRRPRLILDLDDVESVAKRRHLHATPSRRWVNRVFHYYDLIRLSAYERRAIRRFDRVFVCSDRDRAMLARPNIIVVPNGIDVPTHMPKREPETSTLLFCGLLSYWPNRDAVRYFVESILPHIQHEIPSARLLVVGRSPSADLRDLADGAAVCIEADVPSVVEYYGRAAIAIVPLRMGGGTRIKILEAWALGVPVVTTSIGCEGLEGIDGSHFIVADTPIDFARACVDLLRSPSHRERLARCGRELAYARYRWETSTRNAIDAVGNLLNLAMPPVTAHVSDPCHESKS
jgi:glycosyltransferase involved in cell wall biosynthesis